LLLIFSLVVADSPNYAICRTFLKMRYFLITFFISAVFLTGCAQSGSQTAVSTKPASTYIQNKGSDTIVNLALAWAERYQTEHPDISISVTGGGSGTGFVSLINGTVDIANASRAIKPEEEANAKKAGFKPVEFVIARDAIAVIVNPNNPVKQLTIDQISKIFKGEINNWSELGGEDRPIVRLSRESNSGTHTYFLETVVRKGNAKDKSLFSPDTLLLPSSEGIISEVQDNPNAIGYDGLGYITPQVKVLPVSKGEGQDYIAPSVETVNNGKYPVARDLYMYTRNEPQGAIKDYLDWIVTPEGQKIVGDLGFVPIKTK
jgi:phosphate transport system substrate-binding protein